MSNQWGLLRNSCNIVEVYISFAYNEAFGGWIVLNSFDVSYHSVVYDKIFIST